MKLIIRMIIIRNIFRFEWNSILKKYFVGELLVLYKIILLFLWEYSVFVLDIVE